MPEPRLQVFTHRAIQRLTPSTHRRDPPRRRIAHAGRSTRRLLRLHHPFLFLHLRGPATTGGAGTLHMRSSATRSGNARCLTRGRCASGGGHAHHVIGNTIGLLLERIPRRVHRQLRLKRYGVRRLRPTASRAAAAAGTARRALERRCGIRSASRRLRGLAVTLLRCMPLQRVHGLFGMSRSCPHEHHLLAACMQCSGRGRAARDGIDPNRQHLDGGALPSGAVFPATPDGAITAAVQVPTPRTTAAAHR